MCKVDTGSQSCIINHGHISMIDFVWEWWDLNQLSPAPEAGGIPS